MKTMPKESADFDNPDATPRISRSGKDIREICEGIAKIISAVAELIKTILDHIRKVKEMDNQFALSSAK